MKISSLIWIIQCLFPLFSQKHRIANTYGSSKVYSYLKFLDKTEKYSKDELKYIQEKKLRNLICHAYENIPFYHNAMKQIKLYPKDINTLEDLNLLPILTKDVIQRNSSKMVVHSKNKYKFQTVQTGGSTGKPLTFHRDLNDNYFSWAAYLRSLKWMGYDWGDNTIKIWGASVTDEEKLQSIGGKIEKYIINNVRKEHIIDAFMLNDSELHYISDIIPETGSFFIRGYVNAVNQYAKFVKKNNLSIHPKGIITTAEMLLPTIRNNIENTFNCEVFDNYGCGETMSIAYECKAHQGLHVVDEHVIVEFIENLNNPESGNKGNIVITNLDNYYMPFIRYVNGDIGNKITSECPCGLFHSKIAYIEGRKSDLIQGINGQTVHGEFFTHLLEETGWIKEYEISDFEVVQESLEKLHWRFVAKSKLSKKDEELLNTKIEEYLGKIENHLEYVNYIELTKAGKRRFTRTLL